MYRNYQALELKFRIKPKRRLQRGLPDLLAILLQINEMPPMDFMHVRLTELQSLRTVDVIDDYKREGPGIEVD